MDSVKAQEVFKVKGRITLRAYKAGALDAVEPLAAKIRHWQEVRKENWADRERIKQLVLVLRNQINETLRAYSLGVEIVTDNLIMTGALTGRDLLVQYLINGTTYPGINYGALGTGSTTPSAGDTQLTSESARAIFSTAIDTANNEAQFQFYFPDANLPNGTYTEAGSFMNGTATANSGQIFNHALLATSYTKSSGTDVTLETDITFS